MHPSDVWDFDDPSGSERRFRTLADGSSPSERAVWLTQAARVIGLQHEYDDAHALLDGIEPDAARPLFAAAAARAADAGLDKLHVDALHMAALVAPADRGDFVAALAHFEDALAARERIGDAGRTRVARWMVAWALRNLGRRGEALAMQRALKAELDEIGDVDPYVDEELALLDDSSGTTRR